MAVPTLGILEWFRPGEEQRVERAIEALDRIGITHLRTGVSWAEWMTPGGRDWYKWLMPTLTQRLDVLPCFSYTPPGLSEPPGTNVPPRDLKDYGAFVCYFIELLGEHFEWVELWNEPDNHREWNASFDADYARFAEMVGMAGEWSRKLGKKTLLGGLANADPNFLSLMHDHGTLEHMDAVGVHGFPFSFEFYWEGWPARVQKLRERLDWCGYKQTPVWITECGYSTWRRDPLPQVTTFADALSAPAERVYWYALDDLDPDLPTVDGFHSDEREYHFGLRTADGRDKLLGHLLATGTADEAVRLGRRLVAQTATDVGYHLITGGCGTRATAIVERLIAAGERVVLYDNLSGDTSAAMADRWLDTAHVMVADTLDEHRLREAVGNAVAVTHAAFVTDPTRPLHEFDTNARGTLNVLDAIARLDRVVPLQILAPEGAAGTTKASLAPAQAYRGLM